jgi:sugar lactone lactonase YvrE
MIACSVSSRCGSLRAKRRPTRGVLRSVLLSAVVGLSALMVGQSSNAQQLFIADAGANSVKQFNAANGAYAGAFVAANSGGLNSPRGMIFTDGRLVVVNQNATLNVPGEVLRFDAETGTFIGKLVSSSDRDAPFAPRGIVRGGPGNNFYVADAGTRSNKCNNEGDVKQYDAGGAFLSNLDRTNFRDGFYPRGVVFGPDGLLYVSAGGCPISNNPHTPLIGYILRFDPRTNAFVDVFASDETIPDLHRPEGLVFDSDGNMWVRSLSAGSTDTDKILKLDGKTGHLLYKLELDVAGSPRSYAEAIIFGPGGYLYIPITGLPNTNSDPKTTGEVRRCNTKTLPVQCDVIVKANSAGGPLQQPWYPIFRNSDPATLSYHN